MATTDETATYIGDLATSPPIPADNAGRFKGGAEIRKTKAIMKASFPNITGAVTVTQDELNATDGMTAFIDDDTMATALSTTVRSSESIKAYIDGQFTPAETTLSTVSGTSKSFFSINAAFIPLETASRSIPAPVIPPPMTRRSHGSDRRTSRCI